MRRDGRPCIEDIETGYRLRARRFRIALRPICWLLTQEMDARQPPAQRYTGPSHTLTMLQLSYGRILMI